MDNTDLNERKAITKVFKSHQTALMQYVPFHSATIHPKAQL